jgi:hypothetical protein
VPACRSTELQVQELGNPPVVAAQVHHSGHHDRPVQTLYLYLMISSLDKGTPDHRYNCLCRLEIDSQLTMLVTFNETENS